VRVCRRRSAGTSFARFSSSLARLDCVVQFGSVDDERWPDERVNTLPAEHRGLASFIPKRNLEKQSVVQLELPLGLEDEARRPGAKKGATRWLADRAVDMIRKRFGWGAVGYASVVLGISHSIPDEFRELTEKEL
jgi:hypothetical protein